MASHNATRETIVRLLSHITDGGEIRTYLRRFSEVDKARFAVIRIGGSILANQLEETAASLALLHTVGLTPIVIHGGTPQLDERLVELGIDADCVDGVRITSPEIIDAARDAFTSENIGLVEALRAQGVVAHGLTQGVFEAQVIDHGRYGLVGAPTFVHLGLLRSVVGSGAIPIIACLGVAPGGQLVSMTVGSATSMLVQAVRPLKIIFLASAGGLLNENGQVVDAINLVTEYDQLVDEGWVPSRMRLKLSEIKRMLDDAPLTTSVSITSPAALVRELFTHSGDGTLVRRGEAISKLCDAADIEKSQLIELIESAFVQTLAPNWWDELNLSAAYIAESYRAAAVLVELDELTYLDKFAVHETARGEGLARALWNQMIPDFPSLVWRSRLDNPFNAFYQGECDGAVTADGWIIFWTGLTDFRVIGKAVERLSKMPTSFLRHHDG